ncbi:MAG: gliding motility-associated C-terminal domain-containing protein [Bacteroidetes bacterium]|nr:gliding motility-associated C-terminal domain-containing protein [Bacteroidota bacterium]
MATVAQKQANIWYFADYLGLDFNYSPPKILLDGKITSNNLPNDPFAEASSVASDENGHLLFYTDGVYVWNKNQQVMPNGTGLFGNSTTTQTLIVPQPGNDRLYYIFTASAGDYVYTPPDKKGFRYSIVDLSLNGGLGDVTDKNILLSASTTEKMAATLHRNRQDIWVAMHEMGNDVFRAYLINPKGLNRYPVLSSTGAIMADYNFNGARYSNSAGQLKFSPNGKMLASAIANALENNGVELYDFDTSNGTVVFSKSITMEAFEKDHNEYYPYGIEFSKGAKYLYVTIGAGDFLYQFDLSKDDVQKSKVSLTVSAGVHTSQLQLAPDGKIYVANDPLIGPRNDSTFMGVINSPDSAGNACHYNGKQIAVPFNWLTNNTVNVGLPNFLSSYFYDPSLFPIDTSMPNYLFEMPNVFTPNGDGLNERFIPIEFYYIKAASLTIVNRWGKEVFKTNDVLKGWEGGECADGTYYWFVKFVGENGQAGSQHGWVQLMR